eukprot:scaffold60296_cov71-Phaeocystis_antarctica.AAC.1
MWCPASSNMLRAFALSSAASSVRLTRGGGTVPSQGKASEAALFGARALAGARRSLWAVGPLSHSPRWREPQV